MTQNGRNVPAEMGSYVLGDIDTVKIFFFPFANHEKRKMFVSPVLVHLISITGREEDPS